jgi:hypothetical protein
MKNKFILPAAILVGILSAPAIQAQEKRPVRSKTTRAQGDSESSTRLSIERDRNNGVQQINYQKDGDDYKIWLLNDKIVDLYINNKKIEEADYPKYQSMIDKLLEQMKEDRARAEKDRERAQEDRRRAEGDRREAERHREQAERDRRLANEHRQRAEDDRRHAARAHEQAERDRERANRDRERAEHDRARADDDRRHVEKAHEQANSDRHRLHEDRERAERDRHQANEDRHRANEDRKRAERDRARASQDRVRAERDRERAEVDRRRAEADRKLMNDLIDELVREKVVSDRDDVESIELTEESLIVNDKKQSGSLHRQLKEKYLKTPGSRIRFTHRSDGTRLSIDRE